jgi:hypothetical protein
LKLEVVQYGPFRKVAVPLCVSEREARWKVVVDTKFGCAWGGWCSIDPFGTHGVGLGKNIRKGWRLFCSHTKLELGDGCKIKFWDDVCASG